MQTAAAHKDKPKETSREIKAGRRKPIEGAHAAPPIKDRQNKSVVKAAKAGNVSESGVRRALEVRKKAPDLAAKVEAGELALGKAVKMVKAVKSEAWQAEQERICAEANAKRSKAMKGVAYAPKGGSRKPEKEVQQTVVQRSDHRKGQAAKAKASNTNPGAVARGDKLLKDRPVGRPVEDRSTSGLQCVLAAVLDGGVGGGGRARDRLASERWGRLVYLLTRIRMLDRVSA